MENLERRILANSKQLNYIASDGPGNDTWKLFFWRSSRLSPNI